MQEEVKVSKLLHILKKCTVQKYELVVEFFPDTMITFLWNSWRNILINYSDILRKEVAYLDRLVKKV